MSLLTLQNTYLFLGMLGTGVLAGFSSGLFGIGGGIVLVPAFLTLLPYFGANPSVVMHLSVGTCLILIVPAALMASRKQYQMGKLDLKILKVWIPPVLVGVLVGVLIINYISTRALKIIFTSYLFAVTLYSVYHPASSPGPESFPKGPLRSLVGFFIGGLSVLLGIGGGTFTVPYYKFCGYPLKKSIALSSATSFFIGLGGGLGTIADGWSIAGRPPYSLGYIFLPAFLLLTPVVMFFAPLGSRAANAVSDKTLKWIYTAFLATVTAYMLYRLL